MASVEAADYPDSLALRPHDLALEFYAMAQPLSVGRRIAAPLGFADRMANTLRGEIERGIFRRGERLPTEHELSASFGVSRAVVREAMSALRQDGIVESFQGKGVFVSVKQPEPAFRLQEADLTDHRELEQILEFLISHEVAATALAAERRSEVQLAQIKTALERMEQAIQMNESGIDEDVAFHAAIVAATENPFFISFSSFLENRVRHLIRRSRENSRRAGLTAIVQKEHQAIFEAIAAKDKASAQEAAERHVRNAGARLRERQTPS